MDDLSTLYVNDAAEPLEGDAETRIAFAAIYLSVPAVDCGESLRKAGLKPTRQRVALGKLLFGQSERHVTAEMLFIEAVRAGIQMSQATVYNTLNHFTKAGLLRRIGVGSRSFFDTNATVHPHFFLDGEDVLINIPDPGMLLGQVPQPLPGYEIARVDAVVYLRRRPAGTCTRQKSPDIRPSSFRPARPGPVRERPASLAG